MLSFPMFSSLAICMLYIARIFVRLAEIRLTTGDLIQKQ